MLADADSVRSLSLELSDTRVYKPQIRPRLGTTAHFCKVVVLKSSIRCVGTLGFHYIHSHSHSQSHHGRSSPSCPLTLTTHRRRGASRGRGRTWLTWPGATGSPSCASRGPRRSRLLPRRASRPTLRGSSHHPPHVNYLSSYTSILGDI